MSLNKQSKKLLGAEFDTLLTVSTNLDKSVQLHRLWLYILSGVTVLQSLIIIYEIIF